MPSYEGKDVEFIPMSKPAKQWAEQHARVKDGKYIVRLISDIAERVVVQGKYRKRYVVDPYITHFNFAVWNPLR